MDILKTVKVKNASNVLVQIPKHVTESWGITEGDSVTMYLSENGDVILRPRKGYFNVKKVD